jgi:hypothetical protein
MTARELIEIIRKAGAEYAPDLVSEFAEAVDQDLSFLRAGGAPTGELGPTDAQWPQRPGPPDRYRSEAELWIVFDSFVLHFLDPLAAAVDSLRRTQTFDREQLGRILFAISPEQEEAPELDSFDLGRLQQDLGEMTELVSQLGVAAFGERFRLTDFTTPLREV